MMQGMIDPRKLAKIVEHYNENDEGWKNRNMSTLLRAIIDDFARLCIGEEIQYVEIAEEILASEKLMPQRKATQERILQAETHQARTEIRAEGFPVTRMQPKLSKKDTFDLLAEAAAKKFKKEQEEKRNSNEPIETFAERMARLKAATDAQRVTTNEDYKVEYKEN